MMQRVSRRADSQRALLRALKARLGNVEIAAIQRTGWASATFTGTRHRLELRFGTDAARAAEAGRALPEMEFSLPGHLVAEMAIERVEGATIAVEALTIEED